ncbi:MAG: MetQ/NlpA family ABC transporter substrate-binding protein [Firmicutes bacterium]|nr:MetQ/NlpA family ABC transporter substrate-binding protein [Bacillota bacterium]
MRKQIIAALLSGLLGIMIIGCADRRPKQTPLRQNTGSLTIGVLPDVNSIPFIIAKRNGYFEKEGVAVNIEHFKSAMERDTALQTGNIDGAVSDMLAVVFFNDNGFEVKITSKTNGSFKLVAGKHSSVTSLKQVNGKTIGISANTIIEYLTDSIMETAGMDTKAAKKIAIPKIPTRLEMLAKGKLDLAVLPEPLASVALTKGGSILSSSDRLGLQPGVMVFTPEAIECETEAIKALYRAYNRAVAYLKEEKPENYAEDLIKEAGFPETVKETLTLPNYSKASMPREKELEAVLHWLQAKHLTSSHYSLDQLSDPRFIE